jgi:predicted kinase
VAAVTLLQSVPHPPGWRLDWDGLNARFPWLETLKECAQDPTYHAEGDVWIHTRMVLEALTADVDWRDMDAQERSLIFAAALLHDVGKPACTKTEGERITSRGHSRRGEQIARSILWRLGVPVTEREHITALIRYHQVPFFLAEHPDAARLTARLSHITRCDHAGVVARADARGRLCTDRDRLVENVAFFTEYCHERRCLNQPASFPSDHARFLYFRGETNDPAYAPHDDTRLDVVLMSGLPGAGKDTWIAKHLAGWPVVSLDEIRSELGVDPTDRQGRVVAAARKRAREYLRQATPFVWNATNVSRSVRSHSINLFASYRARVRIVHVETSPENLRERNRRRAHPVPERVLDRLVDRWEPPDVTEAHRVDWIVTT